MHQRVMKPRFDRPERRQVRNVTPLLARPLSCAVWQKRVSPDTDEPFAANTHDYLIAYGKNKAFSVFNRLARTEEADARYLNPDGNSMWLTNYLKTLTFGYDRR
jgi:hypothetical protein